MYDYNEILKLARGLMNRNIPFELDETYDGWGIWLKDGSWDAIIHRGSLGHKQGLLEVMGSIAEPNEFGENVEGWLTANEILARL